LRKLLSRQWRRDNKSLSAGLAVSQASGPEKRIENTRLQSEWNGRAIGVGLDNRESRIPGLISLSAAIRRQ
jgi:hypothetical protein